MHARARHLTGEMDAVQAAASTALHTPSDPLECHYIAHGLTCPVLLSCAHSALEQYPKSSKLVRSYARFLEDVHNDPYTAARFYRCGKAQSAVA